MNAYFNMATSIPEHTLARATVLVGLFQSLGVAFDKLPDPDYLKDGRVTYCADGSAGANVVVLTPPQAALAYHAGARFSFVAAYANTGATTVNVSGLGAVAVKRADGSDLSAADIRLGAFTEVAYDGARFQLMSVSTTAATSAASSAAAAAVSAGNAFTSEVAAASYATVASALAAQLIGPAFIASLIIRQQAGSDAVLKLQGLVNEWQVRSIPDGSFAISGDGYYPIATNAAGDTTISAKAGRTVNISPPGNVVNILTDTTGDAQLILLNPNTGTAAIARFVLNNGTNLFQILHFGHGFTTSTVSRRDGAMITESGPGGLTYNASNAAGAHYWAINDVETMRHNSAGLGIGMTPVNVLDITQTMNNPAIISLLNANVGVSARSDLRLLNSASASVIVQYGTGYTPAGITRADGLAIVAGGAGGLTLNTGAAQPIYFAVNSAEVGQVNASRWYLELPVHIKPGAAVVPANNGDITFEFTDNTHITIKGKGSDGTVRSQSLVIA